MPRGELDLAALARDFELAGGDIRSAADYAAAGDRAIEMDDLLTAIDHEYTKLGRLPPATTV